MRERVRRPQRAYAAIPNAAMRDKSVSIEARGFLALLMTYADDWQFNRAHLMEMSGIGRDKFQRLMGELREAGYVALEQTREIGTGRLLGTEWVIRDERGFSDREPENPVLGATESLKTRPPGNPASGKSGPIRRTTLQEDQKEESPIPPEGAGDLFSADEKPIEKAPRPEEFWKAFPRKIGKSLARKAWAKARKEVSASVLIDRAKQFSEVCRRKGTEEKFIPHPSSWLNAGRWDDEELKGVKLPGDITPQDRAARFAPPSWMPVVR